MLIGPTAIGMEALQDTPIGERMSGSEIQAQLLENLLDGTLLRRPTWAPAGEAILILLFGSLLTWAMRDLHPLSAALLMLALVTLPLLGAFGLFRSQRMLFDAATPALYLLLISGVLLVLALAESTRLRRSLEGVVQAQRERSARIAGELEAAQRIQTASLPRPDLLRDDDRAELSAALTPAREVGGDLYDFFMLDHDRLFLLIGDVAGKGLSASIFMAVSKALYKGLMIRTPGADIGDIMSAANAEVSRDNVEMLFVTVFAAILDLRSGELAYCNAGHENPYRVRRRELAARAHHRRRRSAAVRDGRLRVPQRELPARAGRSAVLPDRRRRRSPGPRRRALRARPGGAVIVDLARDGASTRALVTALQADVVAFADGAEPHDDVTILALRWQGPPGAAPAGAPG